jgi:hypothetical protein
VTEFPRDRQLRSRGRRISISRLRLVDAAASVALSVEGILFPYPRIWTDRREDARVSAFLGELTAYLEREVDREWIDEHERCPTR